MPDENKPVDWDAAAVEYGQGCDSFVSFIDAATRASFPVNGVPDHVVKLLTAAKEAIEDGDVALAHLAEAICVHRLEQGLKRDGTVETERDREAARAAAEAADLEQRAAHRPDPRTLRRR